MALLGLSLILASLVLVCMRRPAWLPAIFGGSPRPGLLGSSPRDTPETRKSADHATDESKDAPDAPVRSAAAIPAIAPPVIKGDDGTDLDAGLGSPITDSASDDGQATPKASAVQLNSQPVPAFALTTPEPPSGTAQPPPAQSAALPPPPSTLMPPPPRPSALRPTPSSSLSSSLAPPRNRNNLPVPNRGPGCSTLAPPPTHSSKPAKPSRAVVLSPGHSPLDWARLSGHPTADLRGLPAGTGYLRVTPSMLKRQTGRKGKDAWTALGGRVYNMTPYLPFHPGGEPELLRCAGRDGTRLFGEIHPWVNYEGMLAACLIGIYVPEEDAVEAAGGSGGGGGGDMEAMD